MNTSRMLTVESVRHPTPSSVQLTFAPPSDPLPYRAGQYLTFEVPVGGHTHPRAYSLVGSPGRADPLSIIVKRVPGGVVSNHLHDHAAPGLKLAASTAQGRFLVEPRPGRRHVVLVGGGSGITPLHAIARELLLAEPETSLRLLDCNVRTEEVILREELAVLANASGGRFEIVHVLDEHPEALGALPGRLTHERALALLRELAEGAAAEFYLCGPEGLLELAGEALRVLEVPDAQIFREHFTPPPSLGEGAAQAQLVTLRVDGETHVVRVAAGQTILDAALAAGVELETSCRSGDCGTCKLRLEAGEVRLARVDGLSEDEEAAGYVLTCVGYPRGPGVVLGDD
jgi:ring-1,2-phenylacetyl-CoA epoxidase subunit PaaE